MDRTYNPADDESAQDAEYERICALAGKTPETIAPDLIHQLMESADDAARAYTYSNVKRAALLAIIAKAFEAGVMNGYRIGQDEAERQLVDAYRSIVNKDQGV